MHKNNNLAEHIGWIETALRREHSNLPRLRLVAQSHYGPLDRIAFVEVHGANGDSVRRRQIRGDASDLLRRLGYVVELEQGRDVYDVRPIRPASAHDELRMLQCLRDLCGAGGEDR